MKIVVTGATGFVGSALVPALLARGDTVTVLSRDGARAKAQLGAVTAITADLETPGPWTASLAGVDTVIHLAGESVAGKRWDARHKQAIRDSRVESTRTIVEAIAALPPLDRPRALLAASGTDYYPFALDIDFDDDEVTETDPPGDSFLARVCVEWEREAVAAQQHGLRVACMRTGLVLGPGGALGKMTTPFKLFVGGKLGHGRQWLSWIHRDDTVAAYLAAASDRGYTGPINLVTDSVRGAAFARALGKALGRPSWMPVPAFALKAAVGEMSEYLLHGRRVVPARLRELGFTWKHLDLAGALGDVAA
ncbi:MAG: TIGR01777 family protein [Deltaproteobacteria bacterium]|nr:TIGR01777 family protein [Deltaproteobacteria bacterium]